MNAKSRSLILITLLSSGLILVGCGDDDDDDAPAGVRVFITSATFDGNLGGLDGADTICTDAAVAAGLDGTWTAWLSGDAGEAEWARNRIVDAQYQLLDGTVVANDLADLTDGTLAEPINLNELSNETILGQNVWTGTDADGSNPGVGLCAAAAGDPPWMSNSDTRSGQVGEVAVDQTWTDLGGGNTCEKANHLYCFADDTFEL